MIKDYLTEEEEQEKERILIEVTSVIAQAYSEFYGVDPATEVPWDDDLETAFKGDIKKLSGFLFVIYDFYDLQPSFNPLKQSDFTMYKTLTEFYQHIGYLVLREKNLLCKKDIS